MSRKTTGLVLILFSVVLPGMVLFHAPALSVILHDDRHAPADKPNNKVIGKMTTDRARASAVAIGKTGWTTTNYIITSQHVTLDKTKTRVKFGETKYKITDVKRHRKADLRICRIAKEDGTDANLAKFAVCYEGADEVGKNIVIGGYGRIRLDHWSGQDRGPNLFTENGTLYGYRSDPGQRLDPDKDRSFQLRWGKNSVDGVGEDSFGDLYISKVLKADFDGPETKNAMVHRGDSGGGWFMKTTGDDWVLVGVNYCISQNLPEHSDEAWFKDQDTGEDLPDKFMAVRVGKYIDWINGLLGAFLDSPECKTVIASGAKEIPPTHLLLRNSPNPFNPSTEIGYTIPAGGGTSPVVLTIYDTAGRLVRKLVDRPQPAGAYSATWDGTDGGGAPAASGLYLCRIQRNGESRTGRMLLVR